MSARLIEQDDRWRLLFDAHEVTQCRIDWAVSLLIAHREDSFLLRIESPFSLTTAVGAPSALLDPEGPSTELGPVLGLLRTPVNEIAVLKDGSLELSLADGASLSVPAREDREAWNITGPRGP